MRARIASAFVSLFSILLIIASSSAPARSQEVKAGDLVLSQAWSRATPGSAKVASGYLTIENKGTTPDRLLGASTDVAGSAAVHEMAMANGVMTMRPLQGGLVVPPSATVKLTPGSNHLMLTGLKRPLKQGENISMTLEFEKAGKIAVTFNVLGVGSPGPAGTEKAGMGGMDHGKMKM